MLGRAYEEGWSMPVDKEKALEYLEEHEINTPDDLWRSAKKRKNLLIL